MAKKLPPSLIDAWQEFYNLICTQCDLKHSIRNNCTTTEGKNGCDDRKIISIFKVTIYVKQLTDLIIM